MLVLAMSSLISCSFLSDLPRPVVSMFRPAPSMFLLFLLACVAWGASAGSLTKLRLKKSDGPWLLLMLLLSCSCVRPGVLFSRLGLRNDLFGEPPPRARLEDYRLPSSISDNFDAIVCFSVWLFRLLKFSIFRLLTNLKSQRWWKRFYYDTANEVVL